MYTHVLQVYIHVLILMWNSPAVGAERYGSLRVRVLVDSFRVSLTTSAFTGMW